MQAGAILWLSTVCAPNSAERSAPTFSAAARQRNTTGLSTSHCKLLAAEAHECHTTSTSGFVKHTQRTIVIWDASML